VGAGVGTGVGTGVGAGVGASVGVAVGAIVGVSVGAVVGVAAEMGRTVSIALGDAAGAMEAEGVAAALVQAAATTNRAAIAAKRRMTFIVSPWPDRRPNGHRIFVRAGDESARNACAREVFQATSAVTGPQARRYSAGWVGARVPSDAASADEELRLAQHRQRCDRVVGAPYAAPSGMQAIEQLRPRPQV
jgi:hypothetical protein